ncbi:MAG: tol-pal system-associated acyl-CoA thioesterase [Steroidobacteraceae bacterium]
MSAPFTFPVRVYWEDTDAGGVVYYASYLRFLERARSEWLRALGVDQAGLLRDERLQFAVVEAHVRYHRPARYDDSLLVSVAVDERRGASVVMKQEIRRDAADGELLISATIRVACLGSDSLRPRPLPAELAALI